MRILAQEGFEIHRSVFPADEIKSLRKEAERISREAGSACIRNPRSRSTMFAALSESPNLRISEALSAVGGTGYLIPYRERVI